MNSHNRDTYSIKNVGALPVKSDPQGMFSHHRDNLV